MLANALQKLCPSQISFELSVEGGSATAGRGEQAYASLSRYFSPNLAQRLASDTEAINLEGQRREIGTLFTDIAALPLW